MVGEKEQMGRLENLHSRHGNDCCVYKHCDVTNKEHVNGERSYNYIHFGALGHLG